MRHMEAVSTHFLDLAAGKERGLGFYRRQRKRRPVEKSTYIRDVG